MTLDTAVEWEETTPRPEVQSYLEKPYRIELIPDPEGWFVQMPELPGCMSQGDTPEDAIASIRDAQRLWIECSLELGRSIPEPEQEGHSFTGKFNVRIPKDLHRQVVQVAEAQGVSLNMYVATVLARDVQRTSDASATGRARSA